MPRANRVSGKPSAIDEAVSKACEQVPGVQHGALVLLAEGVSIAGFGDESAFDRERLVRAAVRCLGTSNAFARGRKTTEFVEYVFLSAEQVTVILRGKVRPRLALVLACTSESNLALVLTTARRALGALELTSELMEWVA